MNSRKGLYPCFLVCLTVLLGFSWSAPAAAGDAADLRLAAGPIVGGAGNPVLPLPIQSPRTMPMVDQGRPTVATGGTGTSPSNTIGVVVSNPSEPQGSLIPGKPGSISNAPKPSFFISPGLVGIYAQLLKQKPDRTPANLRPVNPYRSPDTPADARKYYLRQIVLKFREGAPVRLRDGNIKVVAEPAALETGARLKRSRLEPSIVLNDLAVMDKVVKSVGGSIGRATPNVNEVDLMRLRKRAERNTGAEHPDLNLFYFLYLPELSPEKAQSTLKALKALRSMEVAYFQPIPSNAVDKPPTTTINVTNSQRYLRPASDGGIDVDFARLFAGGRGEDVRIADIEAGWHDSHEDLPRMSYWMGINWGGVSIPDDNHGTAVLGVLAAEENDFGATGIAPLANIGWSSTSSFAPDVPFFFYSVGSALLETGKVLRSGDIALIEQHFPAATAGPCTNRCNCEQWGFVAVETIPYEHAAISAMTRAGVIVVEAAGNGQTMVTPASTEDSGAIVVGASRVDTTAAGAVNNSFAPACFTNFGPRVNVQAWGNSVGSLGYASTLVIRRDARGNIVFNPDGTQVWDSVLIPDLRANGTDADQWYTRTFSGTSSASPIVTGAVALIQSTRSAVGEPKLDPIAMRSLLVSTGTPQAAGTTPNIGPMPNLRAAIATYRPDAAKFISQTLAPNPVAPSTPFNISVTFANSGGIPWAGSHTLSVVPESKGVAVWSANARVLGSSQVLVMPASEISHVFSLTAPAQPGTYDLSFVLRSSTRGVMAASPQKQVVVAAPNIPSNNAQLQVTVLPGTLRAGQSGTVTVSAYNTGGTVWTPESYGLKLSSSVRIGLPKNYVAVPGSTQPGTTLPISFEFICNNQGSGWWRAQMVGGGAGGFGNEVTSSVLCQP